MPGILGAFWQVDSPRERDLGFFFRQLERVRACSADEAVKGPDLSGVAGKPRGAVEIQAGKQGVA